MSSEKDTLVSTKAMRQDFQSVRNKRQPPSVSPRRVKKAQYARDRALHDAVSLNRTDKLPALMKTGANPARIMPSLTKDSYGRRRKTTALHMAVMDNRIDALREMIAYAPLLDTRDLQGRTALHLAVKEGNVRMVDMLLQAGAARDIKAVDGKTPLQMIEGWTETGSAAEIQWLFNAAEGRDCQKSLQTDQRINVRPPLQIKKSGPAAP